MDIELLIEQNIIEVVVEQPVVEVVVEPVVVEINNNPIAIKGDDGTSFTSQEFIISSPSAEWVINHNKNYYPNITVLDIFNKVVIAEIEHTSLNQVRIYTEIPQTGKVIVN